MYVSRGRISLSDLAVNLNIDYSHVEFQAQILAKRDSNGDMMSTQQNNSEVADGHSFADKIGQLVTSKYQALFGTTTYSKRRVMSGIVLTRMVIDEDDVKEETFEVICVSSGTKCINGEQLSLEGCVINDSHAEIVSRRCFIYYLYSQLENYDAADPEKSILEIADDGKFK